MVAMHEAQKMTAEIRTHAERQACAGLTKVSAATEPSFQQRDRASR